MNRLSIKMKKSIAFDILFFLIVFASMLVFFESAHRLVILDADDWTYISQSRIAVPSFRFWNPARIMPEILMPYCSELAVLLIMPLCGDYIDAITIMNGAVLSIFIAVYVFMFYRLLCYRFSHSRYCSAWLAILFLIMHFWIYRIGNAENNYLFISRDVTCIYYYTIPALLNCSLVLYFCVSDDADTFFENGSETRKGILVVLVYFAVFSNLFSSIILPTWFGCEIVFGLLFSKSKIKDLLKKNAFRILVIILWCVSAFFEGNGGRGAEDSGYDLVDGMITAAREYVGIISDINDVFFIFCALMTVLCVIAFIKKIPNRMQYMFVLLGISAFVIVSVFLVVLCSRVNPLYIVRPDVQINVMFFVIALCVTGGAFVLKEIKYTSVVLPLLVTICLSDVVSPEKTFAETNSIRTSPEIVAAISRDVASQLIDAAKSGQDEIIIYAIDNGFEGPGWPHTEYFGGRMSESLYKHGLISRPVEVLVVPSKSFNEKYGLSFRQ